MADETKKIDDGGPAFPQVMVQTGDGTLTCAWDGYGRGGMSLRDWLAATIVLDTRIVESVNDCDDDDLLNRFGTEAEKGAGFLPVYSTTSPQFRHVVAAAPEYGQAMPVRNIELRQTLEARARAAIRYAEADAMLAARSRGGRGTT